MGILLWNKVTFNKQKSTWNLERRCSQDMALKDLQPFAETRHRLPLMVSGCHRVWFLPGLDTFIMTPFFQDLNIDASGWTLVFHLLLDTTCLPSSQNGLVHPQSSFLMGLRWDWSHHSRQYYLIVTPRWHDRRLYHPGFVAVRLGNLYPILPKTELILPQVDPLDRFSFSSHRNLPV